MAASAAACAAARRPATGGDAVLGDAGGGERRHRVVDDRVRGGEHHVPAADGAEPATRRPPRPRPRDILDGEHEIDGERRVDAMGDPVQPGRPEVDVAVEADAPQVRADRVARRHVGVGLGRSPPAVESGWARQW